MNMNCDRQTAELGRQLNAQLALKLAEIELEDFRAAIDQARQWLRDGAPGRALEILDAARERIK